MSPKLRAHSAYVSGIPAGVKPETPAAAVALEENTTTIRRIMPNETTTPYRAVLEELAHSRGLSGAEELTDRAAGVAPGFTPTTILEKPRAG